MTMADNGSVSFGQGLLEERKVRRWTQEQLADEIASTYNIHVSLSSIHRWENDDATPHRSTREKLYKLFGKTDDTWGIIETKTAIWNVPFARNLHFTGREPILVDMQRNLSKRRPTALCGLGGIGKTQTAVEYAYRYSNVYDTVLWVRADTLESLAADIVAIVDLLDLPERAERNQARVIKSFKRWLQVHTSWLLIFDNADTIDTVSEFLSLRDGGAILLTTRTQRVGRHIKKIEVEQLSHEEGVSFLLRRAKHLEVEREEHEELATISELERDSAAKLCELLDGLPLALDQAAAYIEETQCSVSEYLTLYQAYPSTLLKRVSTVNKEDYSYSVATTWTLSFQQIEHRNAAADLLSLCAFLHPDAIPIEFLIQGTTYLSPSLQQAASDAAELNEIVGILLNYSLLRRDAETQVLTIHRLVQAVLKQSMSRETYEQWVECTIQVVNATFPTGEFSNWERCEYYLPHVQVCAALIAQHQLVFAEAAGLLQRAGSYLTGRSRFLEAETLLRQTLVLREQLFGLEHLTTAETLNALGIAILEMSRFDEAEQFLSRSLAIRVQQLGEAHLDVAETLHHLADLCQARGRDEEAEAYYKQALAIRRQLLGSLHIDVATIMDYLGGLYCGQRRWEEAESLIRPALSIREQLLGLEHPDVAESLNDLALIFLETGKYEEAEPLLLRTVELMKKQLGLLHRYTATAINNLANLYKRQDRYAEAEQLWQQVLYIREQVLGLEHIDLVNVLYYLITLYREQGRYEEIRPLLERAMTIYERRSEQEPPRVVAMINELAELTRSLHLLPVQCHLEGEMAQDA